MALNPSKEAILKKIRNAYTRRNNLPPEPNFSSDIYTKSDEQDLAVLFAQNFIKTKAEFFYVDGINDLHVQLRQVLQARSIHKHIYVWEKSMIDALEGSGIDMETSEKDFAQAEVGITGCDFLVARTGSLIVSSGSLSGRRLSVYPHIHIVIATVDQIVYDIKDALEGMKQKYPIRLPSMICLETGPSRTADIEKTLVLGAHGPKELLLFLLDETL
ncbi:MAG: lactate utilization protein [Cytophagaceae bacterium]|jgi:L-lactate dehydrogenase complex protein LldG|nr:lactate utilization protein [Cytophagaceae bacterium]